MVTTEQLTSMNTLYIVFDKLPKKNEGGLVATYINLVAELKDNFNIEFISVFKNEKNDIDEFEDIPIHVLSNMNLDNRFFRALDHLRKKDIKAFVYSLVSGIYFFLSIPINKFRTRRFLKNKMVIASSPAAAIFLSSKLKYILEIHTSFEYFWGRNRLGRAQSKLIPKPSITVFRNKSDADKASSLFPSTFIYNAFDSTKISRPKKSNKIKHSILFVGRLVPEKNPLRLINCALQLKKSIPNFTLDIYGEGPLYSELERCISKNNLENNVHLKGFIDDKSIYSRYEVLWVTSQFEGFGLVIIEAMANGTPTVSSSWGDAINEIINNGRNGYIAKTDLEFAEYTEDLINDSALYSKISKNAYSTYEKQFNCEANKQSWLTLLAEIYK